MKVLFHCTDLLFILLPGDCPCECFCECPFRLFSVYLFTHICRYTSIFSYLNHTVYILHLDFFFEGGSIIGDLSMLVYAYLPYFLWVLIVFHGLQIPWFILLTFYYGHLLILNIGFCEQCFSEPLCTYVLV